jgi:hypothetical protein
VSFFVPNLDPKKSALAGLGGGFLGGLAFAIMSWIAGVILPWPYVAGMFGRFGGASILGFCIGLMVAVVEAAFRRAWLEVRFSEREVITVNLGPEPVKVGGNAKLCTVWARGAADVALRYWIRDGKVHCEDVPGRQESTASNGDTREAGKVTVVVRTSSSSERGSDSPRPSNRPSRPAPPPLPNTPAKPQAASVPPAMPQVASVPVAVKPSAPTPPATLPQPSAPPAIPAKAAQPDWDDGLPMPMSPPPPPRPATASILDIDDMLAGRAAKPQAANAPSAPAQPPVPSAPAKPPTPPAPAPKVPAPPSVPKPPAPAAPAPSSEKQPGDPDACPSCGRKSPGKPGARYCMVCDRTF